MSMFTTYLLALLKFTALVCVGILCACILYGLLYLIIPREPLAMALETIGLESLARFVMRPDHDYSEEDFSEVVWYKAIQSWIVDCMGFGSLNEAPSRIKNILALPSQYYPPSSSDRDSLPQGVRMPNHGELALTQLSRALITQGTALRPKVRSAYFFWQCTSLIAIVLGMITTILVSVSSTEFGRGDGWNQRLIRIFAIVFPALGTAAAAVIAFYSPQAEWSQVSRTLASVNQLHGQIALGVWKLPCPQTGNNEDTKLLTTALEDWSKRYHDIQTISTTTIRTSGSGSERDGGSGKPGSGNTNQGGEQGSKPPP